MTRNIRISMGGAQEDRTVLNAWLSKIAVAACVSFAALGTALSATPALAQTNFSAQDLADLERVSEYLNGLGNLSGRFIQISDTGGGFAEGDFYMSQRTRLRFEYDPPIPLIFISDGTFVGIANSELETTSQYPIAATPLRVLLRREVDLAADAHVTSVERLPGQLRVVATEDSGIAQGELTLVFSDPGLELRQWIIVDAHGRRTTIALRDVREVEDLPRAMFRFPRYESDIFE
ncbi:outer-membrane lipoprotein carrier protein LolA [bacterium AH-315-P15]|nr:outer-membrane lipoprotein carrier protein LolA [bacterium AH-315-P15]